MLSFGAFFLYTQILDIKGWPLEFCICKQQIAQFECGVIRTNICRYDLRL